ncbi:MAG: hypothetical protein PHG34_06380 [Candidatus Cloacimonetes bacterium]|jgi:hypothetical protein|nr:hypothetical protein [Candidatus Cloacimonadota bacterium]MDD3563342.1 hypothetical protein [Candidatus Cloacimonadota bacterium]
MNKNIVFITIGNRDLQKLYKRSDSDTLYRCKTSYSELKSLSNVEVKELGGIKERSPRPEEKTTDGLGITFPMFYKALAFLRDKGVKKIDYLFIIATKRDGIIPKLKQVLKKLEESEDIDYDLHEYLEQGLIRHAENDHSSDTAHFLEELINAGKIPLGGITIDQAIVLDLGTYGFLQPIQAMDLKNKISFNTLRLADINVLDFFTFETYQALLPHFGKLENERLFLATHAGGMPLMQRALDIVLDSILGYAEITRIYNSENLLYQMESKPQGEFLTLMKQMHASVLSLDWNTAMHRYDSIKKEYATKLPDKVITNLNGFFKEVSRSQASGSTNWFDRFTVLILQALYQRNMNDVIVWLKCMEEAALKESLHAQKGKLWKDVKELSLYGSKKTYIILEDDDGGNQQPREAYLDTIAGYVDQEQLKIAMQDYLEIFIAKGSWEYSDTWRELNRIRNKLLHAGIPVVADQSNVKKLLDFLHIDALKLDEVISDLQDKNLAKVLEFERECMDNKFFEPIRKIAKNYDANYLPYEREMCKQYFKLLHGG